MTIPPPYSGAMNLHPSAVRMGDLRAGGSWEIVQAQQRQQSKELNTASKQTWFTTKHKHQEGRRKGGLCWGQRSKGHKSSCCEPWGGVRCSWERAEAPHPRAPPPALGALPVLLPPPCLPSPLSILLQILGPASPSGSLPWPQDASSPLQLLGWPYNPV